MHPNDTALNDYVDGALGPGGREDIDRHLAGCAVCRQTVEDLRAILAATRELEPSEPPVRAWSRLDRAIKLETASGKEASAASAGPARAGRSRVYAAWLAAAAALVLATVVGMRYTPHTTPSGGTLQPASMDTASSSASAQSIETELRQAEAHYENAIKGLETIANTAQSDLDPRTAATLHKNLAVIDQAI